MAKIYINFDKKSISNAIKQIQQVKKTLQNETTTVFLTRCLNWIRTRANEYLDMFNIDQRTISDIKSNWEANVVGNVGTLINKSYKAVFVEFGVGAIGATSPHPNAPHENYEYNVPSDKKDRDGKWRFKVDEDYGVDLIAGYYSKKENTITTSGSPSTLYLYNAMMDLISSGIYKTLWKEALKQTI